MTKSDNPDLDPLFSRVLGQNWDGLPAPVRNMHDIGHRRIATGLASVERGTGIAANVIAWLFGFPNAAASIPVQVTFERSGTGEVWTRSFGEASFTTRLDEQTATTTRAPVVVESFGPLSFILELRLQHERLYLTPIAWNLFRLPLPIALAPYGNSYEFSETGRFAFHIEVNVPLAGLIVCYRGTLHAITM